MPEQNDAVLYRWADLPKDVPMQLLERRRVIGRQAMISQVFLKKGCDVPMHAHENEQFACILSGQLTFQFGAAERGSAMRQVVARAGDVLHLPSNVVHSAFADVDTLVLDIFSPPSEKTGIDRH